MASNVFYNKETGKLTYNHDQISGNNFYPAGNYSILNIPSPGLDQCKQKALQGPYTAWIYTTDDQCLISGNPVTDGATPFQSSFYTASAAGLIGSVSDVALDNVIKFALAEGEKCKQIVQKCQEEVSHYKNDNMMCFKKNNVVTLIILIIVLVLVWYFFVRNKM